MTSPSLLLSQILLTSVVVSGEPATLSVEVPSRVNGTVGRSVVLPCTLKSPYADYTTIEIVISWKIKVFYRGPVLFNVTNRSKGSKEFENEVHTNIKGRYKLAGDPRKGNAALELQNATLDDSDQYFCRVEINRQGLYTFKAESNPGITLEILGAPVILRVSLNVINATHSIIECLAEGQPSPSIIWIDPHNKRLPVNGSDTPVTSGPGRYQTLGELHHPKLGENYTCLVMNDQGNARQSIHLPKAAQNQHRPHRLIYIIGILVGSVILIILLVIGLVILRRRSGRVEFNSTRKRAQPNSSEYSRVSVRLQQTSTVVNRTKENGSLEMVPESNVTEDSTSLTAQTWTPEVNVIENGSLVAVPRTPEENSIAENASLTAVSPTPELNAAEDSASLTAQTCTPEVNVIEDNRSLAAESPTPELNAAEDSASLTAQTYTPEVNVIEDNGSLAAESPMPKQDTEGSDK